MSHFSMQQGPMGGYGPPPQQYGPPPGAYGPPGGYGSMPPPAPKKKSSLPLILGGVGLLVVLIGGGVFAVSKMSGRGGHKGLPVDAKRLPSQTQEMAEELLEATRHDDPRIKKAYVASQLGSSFCRPDVGDPAIRLEILGLFGSQAAKSFFQPKSLDGTQALLDCGQALGAALDSDYMTELLFAEDETTKHDAVVTHFKLEEIPSKFGYAKQNFSGLAGFCRMPPKGEDGKPDMTAECGNDFMTGAHDGTTWFFGKKSSLDVLAKSLVKPTTGDLSTSVSALQDAADGTEGLPFRRIQSQLKTSKKFFQAPCAWASSQTAGKAGDLMTECFPTTVDKQIETIDAKLRAAAYEMDADIDKAGAVHGNIVLIARDNDAAKDVEKDVADIVRDWKSHLENHESKIVKQAKTDPITLREHEWVAIVDTFMKSLRGMKVERNGRAVAVRFNEPLSPDDKRELDDAEKKTEDKRSAVADVLEAVQAKKAVPQPALTKLVGEKWATFLLIPRVTLSAGDCNTIKSNVNGMKLKQITTVEARNRWFTFSSADCSKKHDITEPERACLVAAKTPADFMRCAPPVEPLESEFGPKK